MGPVVLSESVAEAMAVVAVSDHVVRVSIRAGPIVGCVVVGSHIIVVETVVAETRPMQPIFSFEVHTIGLCLQ